MPITETSNKWAAFGSNVMVKVKTNKRAIVLAAGMADPSAEPVGEVVSTGKLVRHADDLICQTIRFNGTMVLHQFGNADEDEYVFVLIPEIAVQAISVPTQ